MKIAIVHDPGQPYPQTPQPGKGIRRADGSRIPPQGLAVFEVDASDLIHGTRNGDIERFYEITAPGILAPKDPSLVDTARLADHKTRRLEEVRRAANVHIETVWPIWRQINADAGIYPPEVKTQKDADIAAVITESNRVEDLIDAATRVAEVDAAVATLNWPVLGG